MIDHNPRRGEKQPFAPHEAERYKIRSQAERTNRLLKDNHGGRHVRVRGAPKVYTHLMFGILVIAAEQILRLLCWTYCQDGKEQYVPKTEMHL